MEMEGAMESGRPLAQLPNQNNKGAVSRTGRDRPGHGVRMVKLLPAGRIRHGGATLDPEVSTTHQSVPRPYPRHHSTCHERPPSTNNKTRVHTRAAFVALADGGVHGESRGIPMCQGGANSPETLIIIIIIIIIVYGNEDRDPRALEGYRSH